MKFNFLNNLYDTKNKFIYKLHACEFKLKPFCIRRLFCYRLIFNNDFQVFEAYEVNFKKYI